MVNAHYSGRKIQEAACFFMFNNVMSDLVDIHIKDFGNKIENPIHSRIRNISTMLLVIYTLFRHFNPKPGRNLKNLK